MTAEIAIMNKQAVAIAADSAVTFRAMGRQKIFPSAQKIFMLSKCNPVGIMVFGNAEFMGVPWETIIKMYKNNLGNKSFDKLKEYAADFIDFLIKKRGLFFPLPSQKKQVRQQTFSYFMFILKNIQEENRGILSKKKIVSEKEFKQAIYKVINKHYEIWDNSKLPENITKQNVEKLEMKYKKVIEDVIDEVFRKLPLTKELTTMLIKIAVGLFTKFSERITYKSTSGIVITGYGKKEVFPQLQSALIEGIANNLLKYKYHKHTEISIDMTSSIMPFAQTEMVYAFMEGVNPDYKKSIETDFSKMLNRHLEAILGNIKELNDKQRDSYRKRFSSKAKQEFAEYRKKLKKYRADTYVQPIMEVVSMLPKDELAILAESLVNLTSLKRKISMTEEETVGGPIDVAVISKSDGFVWIKKKSYFEKELNP